MVSMRTLFPIAFIASLGIASAHAQIAPAANRPPSGPTTIPNSGQFQIPGTVIMAPAGGGKPPVFTIPGNPAQAPYWVNVDCSAHEERIKKLESLVKSQNALIKVLEASAEAGKGK